MSWVEPVTNRTKGAQYTYDDLNRVGGDVQYLAGLLNGYGYAVIVTAKQDWPRGGRPQATDAAAYLADVAALKAAFYGTKTLPASMSGLTYSDANAIEALLVEIETLINNMVAAFIYCGEIYCGEEYA